MADKMAPVACFYLHLSSFSFVEFYQRFESKTPAENPNTGLPPTTGFHFKSGGPYTMEGQVVYI